LYAVSGDEEQDVGEWVQSFANDEFFVKMEHASRLLNQPITHIGQGGVEIWERN
jgi:hypothetical protein